LIQNIYDDDEFFKGYAQIRANPLNANVNIEQPSIWSLLPDLNGKRVIDLGCGTGESCIECIRRGARSVIGLDASKKMIGDAEMRNPHANIIYQVDSIEEHDYSAGTYDCALSSLAFHYIENLKDVFSKIHGALAGKGTLLFSQEHPVITSTQTGAGWFCDNGGNKLHWKLDDYFQEGERTVEWIVKGVKKYHRTIQSIVGLLIDAGYLIQRILEPTVTAEFASDHPNFMDERRVPLFLIIKCRKVA
jgi:SAM-dependent methyltransferase